jgi:phenylacetate-CoA ligase
MLAAARRTVYASLVPRLVLPLHARLSGRTFWPRYRELQALQWQSPATLEARSLEKVRALVAHAMAHVPYYRQRLGGAGVRPEALRTLEDLARLPITRKAELRESPPGGTLADNLPASRRWRAVTSGSTGSPFELFTDAASADGVVAAYLLSLDWAGTAIWHARIDIGNSGEQPMPSALPSPSAPVRWARRLLLGERVTALFGVDLSPEVFLARARTLGRVYFVRGYPAYLARLAHRLLEAGLTPPVPPRVVISGGETLTALDAGAIERAFGCPVVNHYAAWEVPHMAQTCPDNPRVLHVNSERVVLRIVGEDGRPATPGSPGRIVVTALDNYVMPFINYEIGDTGVAGAPCPCGRGFPTLATVEGRLGDSIRTPAGRLVSPVTLDSVFRFCADYVREFQAERTAPATITVRVVPTPRFSPEVAQRIRSELERHAGPGMEVRVETVPAISLGPSGKRSVITSSTGESSDGPRPRPASPGTG